MKPIPVYSYLFIFARLAGRLSLAAVHVLVVAVLAWHALRFYPGDRWLPVRLGSYFAPWLFMALLPALLIALLGRRRWLTRLVLALILAFGIHYEAVLWPRLAQVKAKDNTGELRVMTFNVNFANRNAEEIAQLLRAEKPDIIAFQEMTGELQAMLRPKLISTYPYFLADNSSGLPLVLVSRYPLTAQPRSPETPRALFARVETPQGSVAIWNVHPCPGLNQDGWEAQRRELTAVAQEIERQNSPLIVLGDFNTTDQAGNYRLVANHLTDVYRAVGQGFGFTFPDPAALNRLPWPGPLFGLVAPAVSIDHIFVSAHFTPQEIHVIPESYGSDHRPVVATLGFVQ